MSKKLGKGIISVLFSFMVMMVFQLNAEAAGTNLSTAEPIRFGSTLSGSLDYYQQSDYYKFTLKRNCIVNIKVETNGHDEHCFASLYNSDGEGVFPDEGSYLFSTNDDNNWGTQRGSRKVALNAGTYYLQIEKGFNSEPMYTAKVTVPNVSSSTVKIAGQNNQYRSKALAIKIGNKITSVVENGFNSLDWDDTQYYKFTVGTKRTVVMNFFTPQTRENDQIWFYLYDKSGNIVANLGTVKSRSDENRCSFKKILKAGTYYIGVATPDAGMPYTIRTAYKPYTTKITALTSRNKRTMTVTWKKKSPTTGYQIQYSRYKNFKNPKSVKVSGSYKSKKITGLTRGKRYYVRVRRYNKSFGITYYSPWSAKKSIIVK